VQVKRQEAQVIGQPRAVVMAVAGPLSVVHAQSVDQQQQPVARGRAAVLCQRAGRIVAIQRAAPIAHTGRDGEGVGRARQVVAEDAVRDRAMGLELRRSIVIRVELPGQRETAVYRAPDQVDATANAAVDEAGDTPRATGVRSADGRWAHLDRAVNLLDDVHSRPCGRADRAHRAAGILGRCPHTFMLRACRARCSGGPIGIC
jgi:hypothetical protein